MLVVMGLSLLLSRFHALAQPAVEIAALTVEKTANTDVAEPGDTLIYTIRIQETGPEVTLWMTDTLPQEVTYVDGSLQLFGPGSAGSAGGVITWTASNFGFGNFAVVTFSVQIPSETTATQVENTAQVTGTGQLVMDSANTTILSGQLPTSQIRSPDNGTVITQKGLLAISGVAWDASAPRPFPGDPVLLPISNFDGGGAYNVKWTAAISAENYILEEADNPEFDNRKTYPSTSATQQFVGGQGVGTYYYRVKAYNAEARPSRWSNVESVVVTQPTWASSASSVPAIPSAPDMPARVSASGPVTVWVRIDAGTWQTATATANPGGWWDWTYEWLLPEEDNAQYAIHTQARDAVGSLSLIDTITVTLRNRNYMAYFPLIFKRWPPICYPPTLNAITDPEGDGAYAVLWSYPYPSTYPQPINYTLQEATNASFTTGVQSYSPGNTTSQAISGKAPGTYYYRVQGNNTYGPGEWSNVQSVTVVPPYYFDDFSNPNSGWPQVSKTVIPETASRYRLLYENGRYRIMIDAGGPPIWFHHPDALAPYRPPTDKYCVETSVKLERGKAPYQNWNYYPYWANGGLVFGATEDNKGIYAVCLTVGGGDTMGWFITSNPVYSYPRVGCAYQGENGGGPRGGEPAGVLSISEWHRIKVGVDGNRAAVYINGVYKGSWGMSGLSGTTRVGLIGGDYEVTPVDFRFDDFKVIPNAACTP